MKVLYGLFDAARDPELYRLITASEHSCLISGRVDRQLAQVLPYVVRIDSQGELMAAWRARGWGQSWGIFCRGTDRIDDVRRHFKKFLNVMLPSGEIVLFRFYDPRVWRDYIITCETVELDRFFSEISEYYAESPNAHRIITYTFRSGSLLIY